MKKYIVIKADTNDADYITEKREITDKKIEEIIRPVANIIKANKESYNWETGEMEDRCTPQKLYIDTNLLTKEQVEGFSEYIPYGEYGIHTIESIDIIEVYDEIKLL